MTDSLYDSARLPIAVLLLVVLPVGLLGCGTNGETVPPMRTGTYGLTVANPDTTDLNATIYLVDSPDGATWGQIRVEREDTIDAAIGLSETTPDSLHFRFFGDNTLTVARSNADALQCTALIGDERRPATLRFRTTDVPEAMTTLAKYPPLPLNSIRASWPAPMSDDSIYVVDRPQSTIYLARQTSDTCTAQALDYDASRYRFSSVGVSPDGSRLVAHGNYRDEAVNDSLGYGQSDLFLLHLSGPTHVERIEILPEPVNTSAYDIFASFDEDGHIIFSSSGQPGGNGRQDIHRARKTPDGWTVTAFSDVINTRFADTGPYMGPGNRFLLFFRNARGQESETVQGEDIIYLSRQVDGEWSEPTTPGAPINAFYAYQYGARLSPSGRYLFVTSYRRPGGASVYRIPTADIPELQGLL